MGQLALGFHWSREIPAGAIDAASAASHSSSAMLPSHDGSDWTAFEQKAAYTVKLPAGCGTAADSCAMFTNLVLVVRR